MHTHRSTMHVLVANIRWFAVPPEMNLLAVAPFLHATACRRHEQPAVQRQHRRRADPLGS